MQLDTSTPELRTLAEMIDRRLRSLPSADVARGVVAAVSGGADSTALLLALAVLARSNRIGPLTIGHVDHAARAGSADDARAVEALARRLELRCETRRLAPSPTPSEERLRDARYLALGTIARERNAGVIATGHHADDSVETLLFRIRRGSGLRGLAGIPAARRLDDATWISRPLLDARRHDLIAVCHAHRVSPRVDPTNRDTRKSRNWIRHDVLPELCARHDAAIDLLLAAAETARSVTAEVDRRASATLADRTRAIGTDRHLRVEEGDDAAVLTEWLRRLHLELTGAAPPTAWLRRASGLATAPTGHRLDGRPPTVAIERTRTGLLLTARRSVASRPGDLHTLRPSAAVPSRSPPR